MIGAICPSTARFSGLGILNDPVGSFDSGRRSNDRIRLAQVSDEIKLSTLFNIERSGIMATSEESSDKLTQLLRVLGSYEMSYQEDSEQAEEKFKQAIEAGESSRQIEYLRLEAQLARARLETIRSAHITAQVIAE